MMTRPVAFSLAMVLTLSACQVGHVTSALLPSSQAMSDTGCPVVRAAKPYAPAYADTVWPSEHHDIWRTHAVAAGLPAKITKLQAQSAKLPPAPIWGYIGLDGDAYVMGGAPYLLDVFTKLILVPKAPVLKLIAESLRYSRTVTPYVARIDPTTMAVTTLPFNKGTGVNYTGGMLVDSNGYLYADARSVLYKIDPKTFKIVLSKKLPLVPPLSSAKPNPLMAYNGMQATTDGDLLLKGFPSLGGSAGVMLKVDPTDLSTKVTFGSPQIAPARMVIAPSRRPQYVYIPGATTTLRILIGKRKFTIDGTFSRQYLYSGTEDTEAASDVFMGRGVIFTSNTNPTAKSAMKIFAQGAFDGSQLVSAPAFNATSPGWNFFMAAGDPFKTGIVAVENQVDGHVSGFQVCSGGLNVKKLWENDSIDGSAGMAINYATSQLYADDHQCDTKAKCTLFFAVLDLRTGEELARVQVAGSEPSIGQIFIGPRGRVFYLATDTNRPNGYITRITAR